MADSLASLLRRVDKLEDRTGAIDAPPVMRIVVCRIGVPLDWEASTCRRWRADGKIWELIRLAGMDTGVTTQQLDEFVQRFPIEKGARL
jgi:hypothetical protein